MMRGLVIGGMLAATMLAGGTRIGGEAAAQLDPDAAAYMGQVGLLVNMVSETMDDLVAANQDVLAEMGDEEALSRVHAETGVFEAVYEAAQDLVPPAAFEESHDELMLGFEKYAEAAPLTREGLMRLDADTIAEATALVQEANAHVNEATALLPEASELE